MTARARQNADKALKHPRLAALMSVIPTIDRVNPKALREWLIVAADADPKGAQSKEFQAAYQSVTDWAQASTLSDRASAIFFDPKLITEFGADRVRAAWANPAVAYEELVQMSAAGKLSAQAAEALAVLSEAREMAAASGDGAFQARQSTVPVISSRIDAEARQLVEASASRRLNANEEARLSALYVAKTERDERNAAASQAASQRPRAPPGRRQQLIERSVGPAGLNASEQRELESLYQAAYPEEDPADYAGDDGGYDYDDAEVA